MTILQGPVKSRNLKRKPLNATLSIDECLLCSKYINNGQAKTTCLNPACELLAHLTCLADLFLEPGEYIPIQGNCPFCSTKLKWGDLIRKMKGCSQPGEEVSGEECTEEECLEEECINEGDKADEYPSWFLDCNDDL